MSRYKGVFDKPLMKTSDLTFVENNTRNNDKNSVTSSSCSKNSVESEFWIKGEHGENLLFNCNQCDARYRVKSSLNNHKRFTHGLQQMHSHQNQFGCMFCDLTFALKRTLMEHIVTHRSADGFRCAVCGKVRPTFISIQRHSKTHAQKKIPCPSCDARFKTRWELRSHEIQHAVNRTFPCKVCGEIFANPSRLRTHLTQHRSERYKCGICEKYFNAQSSLNNHRKLHFVDKPFKCQYCSQYFSSVALRKKHFSVAHSDNDIIQTRFECADCSKKYTSTTSLAVHRMKFHNGAANQCENYKGNNADGKCFDKKTSYAAQGVLDEVGRQHSCSSCLSRFKTKRELQRHQREKNHISKASPKIKGKRIVDVAVNESDYDSECCSDEEFWCLPEPEVCIEEDIS